MITLEEYRKRKKELYAQIPEEFQGFDAPKEGREWVEKNIDPKHKKLLAQLSEEDFRALIMAEIYFFDRMQSEVEIENQMDFEKEFERIKKDVDKYR